MERTRRLVQILVVFLPAAALLAGGNTALEIYKSGDFEKAIPLLQAACREKSQDPVTRAAFLSSLVYEGRLDEASAEAGQDAAAFPESPEMTAARGEFAFYMGNMPEAEKLFRSAIALKGNTARAYYDLYRLYRAASHFRTSRLMCLKAHDIDPEDALITKAWIRYLVSEKRKSVEDAFVSAHPWLYKHADRDKRNGKEISRELNKRKVFELDGERKETTLQLISLRNGPNYLRGMGLEFRIGDSRTLRLLLDTGSSGILVKQSAIDKAQLTHLGSGDAWGIGDNGVRNIFSAIADTCQIGALKYKACLIRATEGKSRIAGDEDGLIGPDVFSDYLMEIDFQNRKLHLSPMPDRKPVPQGYDRVVDANGPGFTPVFRMGDHLFVSATVNDKCTGLFLIDTGSSLSFIDSAFAQLSMKIHGNDHMHVAGVSGRVKKVYEADEAVIQFARFRQRNLDLTAFNLNNSPEHTEIRTAGILGLPVLMMFRLTLDYRNGLVKFDYVKH